MRRKPRLFHLLSRAQRAVANVAERESLAALGVTPVQLGLLYTLGRDAPVPLAEVGRALDLSPAGLSGLVDRTVAAGLIERRVSETDRRAAELVMTPRGRALRDRSLPLLDALNARIFDGVPPEHQAIIADFLDSLPDRINRKDTP